VELLAVLGWNAFVCTFDIASSCPFVDDDLNAKETWDIVDGSGFVADNTMNNGQYNNCSRQ